MLSHIRTVTVGYGIAPYLSDTGLADFHRRQGIAPAPEACLIIYLPERKCKQESVFKANKTVRAAWGIVNLLTTVPHSKAQKIKAELLSCFGRSKYYRMRREEIPVMPEDQALIKEIFMKNGIETDPEYSRFTEEYQWSFNTDETLCSGL